MKPSSAHPPATSLRTAASLLVPVSLLCSASSGANLWQGDLSDIYGFSSNWSQSIVPNTSTSVAQFTGSLAGGASVLIIDNVTVGSFLFDSGFVGGNFVVQNSLPVTVTFAGAGIVNQSSATFRIVIHDAATVRFLGLDGSLGNARYEVQTGGQLLVRANRNIDGSSATVQLNGGTLDVTNAIDAGTVRIGSISGAGRVGFGGSDLVVGSNNTDTTFSGTLSPGSLTKVGTGTWTLTDDSSYTGPTLISAGAIKITNTTGSAFGTGAVTLAAGATLTGAGSFSGAFQNNGTYAPGNSPTLATLSSFTQGETGILEIELAGLVRGSGYDALDITGSFAPGGTLTVLLIDGFNPIGGESFDLFNFSPGSITGTFATLDLPDLTPGLSWDASALYTTGVLSVIGSPIPEPSAAAALAGLGALALAATRRRRSRS